MPQICPRYPLYILMISQDIANISPIFAQDIPKISPRSDFIFVTGTKGGTRAENSVMWRHFFLYKTDVKKSPQIYLRYPLSCFLDIPNISQDIHQVSPEMSPKYPQIYPGSDGYPIPDPTRNFLAIPNPYPIFFQNHRVFRVSGISPFLARCACNSFGHSCWSILF